ncbi:CatA-like O-acetyltransferase [Magnetospirillum molischianum]|nr:CatA-like O-acetyltransferase [Magnetospirillum molischianum]
MEIPARYCAERVDPADFPGWLGWSLEFFSGPALQNPHVDVTFQLDVTQAWARYQRLSRQDPPPPSFFSFLVWNLAQTLARHPSFNLRRIDDDWYLLRNPPIFIPVAVGGDARFQSLVLDDAYRQDLATFSACYRDRLAQARSPGGGPSAASDTFVYAHFMGNLPNLRFTGLTLHWRPDQMVGQSFFYFGQRYTDGDRMLIPMSVRLHHSCTDAVVLDQLIEDFKRQFAEDGSASY